MAYRVLTLAEHFNAPSPKRILALDGLGELAADKKIRADHFPSTFDLAN